MSGFTGTYRVVFDGSLTGHDSSDQVKAYLAEEFGLNAETVEALFDGRRHTVKRGVSWQAAQTLTSRFRQSGAINGIELELSPHLWHESLIDAASETDAADQTAFMFRIAGLVPLVLLLPGREAIIERADRRPWLRLKSRRFATGVAARWLAAFVVAINVEIQLVVAWTHDLALPVLAPLAVMTFAGLLYGVAALLKRPRWLTGRLRSEAPGRQFSLSESRPWPVGSRRFSLRAGNETWQLYRHARADRLEVLDRSGALVASAEPGDSASSAAQDLTSELRDEALPFEWLADLVGMPIPGISGKRVWSIFDSDGHRIATFVRGYRCRWLSNPREADLAEPVSLGIALVLAGI